MIVSDDKIIMYRKRNTDIETNTNTETDIKTNTENKKSNIETAEKIPEITAFLELEES